MYRQAHKIERSQPEAPPHPDIDLIHAGRDFVAAGAEERATLWAEDLDGEAEGKAEALALLEAARATQESTARVLVERPATKLAGWQTRARAAVTWFGSEPPDDGVGADILWSLAQDLAGDACVVRLSGRHGSRRTPLAVNRCRRRATEQRPGRNPGLLRLMNWSISCVA